MTLPTFTLIDSPLSIDNGDDSLQFSAISFEAELPLPSPYNMSQIEVRVPPLSVPSSLVFCCWGEEGKPLRSRRQNQLAKEDNIRAEQIARQTMEYNIQLQQQMKSYQIKSASIREKLTDEEAIDRYYP